MISSRHETFSSTVLQVMEGGTREVLRGPGGGNGKLYNGASWVGPGAPRGYGGGNELMR